LKLPLGLNEADMIEYVCMFARFSQPLLTTPPCSLLVRSVKAFMAPAPNIGISLSVRK